MKGILSEHTEQAPMFIKNSFQSTALTWILSLGKKFKLYEFEEKPLTLWKKQSTWISCHPDGDLRTSRCALDEKDEKDLFGHSDEGTRWLTAFGHPGERG